MDIENTLLNRVKRLEALLGLLVATGAFGSESKADYEELEYIISRIIRNRFPKDDLELIFDEYLRRKKYQYRLTEREEKHANSWQNQIDKLIKSDEVTNEKTEKQIEDLMKRIELNGQDMNDIKKEIEGIKKGVYPYLNSILLNETLSEIKLNRFFPLRIYTSIHHEMHLVSGLVNAIEAYYDKLGFEVADEYAPEFHSWFKKWYIKSKEILSRQDVQERLEKGERALELKYLQKEQAQIDKDLSEAASNVLKATENIPNVACQIGSILLVKTSDDGCPKVVMRNLSTKEMIHLEKNQNLLQTPSKILIELSSVCCTE